MNNNMKFDNHDLNKTTSYWTEARASKLIQRGTLEIQKSKDRSIKKLKRLEQYI